MTTNGFYFDLYAITFAAAFCTVIVLVYLAVYALRAKHHRPRPFDWMRDAPEYARPKGGHVKVVP